MLNIAFLTGSVSRAAGGVFPAMRGLAQWLTVAGARVDVIGLMDEYTESDMAAWAPLTPQVYHRRGRFGYAPGLARALWAKDYDLVMVHGIWMYPSVVCTRWSRATRKPYIVNPHGMLDAWALSRSGYKKRLAYLLFEREHLRGAGCLRALCDGEASAFRQFGVRNPICVIPNGVDFPDDREAGEAPPWVGEVDDRRRVLLYLGRLHPKKGLWNLLLAWNRLARKSEFIRREWSLVIAGWDECGYEKVLREQVRKLCLEPTVKIIGPCFGRARNSAYRYASGFILPSFSEGLPVVVQEAWAYGLPVLATAECNLADGFATGAAISVRPDPEDLERGLLEFVSMTDVQRSEMGVIAYQLARDRFCWPSLAKEMIDVCEWVLGRGPKPATVYLG